MVLPQTKYTYNIVIKICGLAQNERRMEQLGGFDKVPYSIPLYILYHAWPFIAKVMLHKELTLVILHGNKSVFLVLLYLSPLTISLFNIHLLKFFHSFRSQCVGSCMNFTAQVTLNSSASAFSLYQLLSGTSCLVCKYIRFYFVFLNLY